MPAVPAAIVALVVATVAPSGCALFDGDEWRYEKPLVAVLPFEEQVRGPFDWRLGEGIAELLADALYQTGRFRVLDRDDLDAVLAEQELQNAGRTREHEKIRPNFLKNAHYLVKGVVTEFAHVSVSGLDIGVGSFRFFGGGNHAVVHLAIKVIEVESGEVVFTSVVSGKTYAGEVDVQATYGDLAVGGYQFFQTPLGDALQQALDDAVIGIDERIGRRIWRPAIAEIDGERVYITGGSDRRLETGSLWSVRRLGGAIVDPHTGDLLGREEGVELGRIRLTRVFPEFSEGVIIGSGRGLAPGQRLWPAEDAGGADDAGPPGVDARIDADPDASR